MDTSPSDEDNSLEYLRKKMEILMQERDCAVEMWHLAELVLNKKNEEIKMLSSNNIVETLQKEIKLIQQDYSDAINLLQNKVSGLEKELHLCKEKKNEILEENKMMNTKLLCEAETREKLEICLKEANVQIIELDKNMEEKKIKLKESEEREKQAREKVHEALESLQEAMENTDAIEDEKEKLEEKLNEIIEAVHEKAKKEMDSVKSRFSLKIESLSTELQTTKLEKNKLSLECENLKSELKLQLQDLQMKNKSLIQELKLLKTQSQNESAMLYNERNSLRRQVNSLQTELESALLQLRDKQQSPCLECIELQEHVERFALLCRKWEEATTSLTINFDKYAEETKQFYQLQEKALDLQNDLQHT